MQVQTLVSKVDTSKFEVIPDDDVVREMQHMHAPVEKMVGEALKFVDGSDEQDLAVQRYFIEKGYSEQFAGWITREANTRRAAEIQG